MYLQCKFGFIEADAWDGDRIPDADHEATRKKAGKSVVVVRSRSRLTLSMLLTALPDNRRVVLESPKGWDYAFRSYVSTREFCQILALVAMGLDYRNFKSWTQANTPTQAQMAMDIWHAAHDAGDTK